MSRSFWIGNDRKQLAVRLLLFILALGFARETAMNFRLGHAVSPSADGYSEANAYRAAMNYNRDGFLAKAGLPKIYGPEWKTIGTMARFTKNKKTAPDVAYTHYPPGPDLTLGLLVAAIGPERMPYYRFLPLSLGCLSLLFFGYTLIRSNYPPFLSVLVVTMIMVTPAFYKYVSGVHYQSYALSVFIVSLSLFLLYLHQIALGSREVTQGKRQWIFTALFFGCGFIQGWLSFDWFFAALLFGLPVWLVFRQSHSEKIKLRHVMVPTLALFMGFSIAHTLHFGQVIIYHGSFSAAVADFSHASRHRSFGNLDGHVAAEIMEFSGSIRHYFTQSLFKYRLFSTNAIPLTFLTLAAICGFKAFADGSTPDFKRRWLSYTLGFVAAVFIAGLWLLIMRQHAVVHVRFTARHFLLPLIVGALIFLDLLRSPSNERG